MVARRLATLEPIHRATQDQGFTQRAGQTLEIAIFRALLSLPPSIPFFGGFPDLADHDDDRLYTKRDPPNFVSARSSVGKLDFLLHHPEAGLVGVEAKNIREWLYPHRDEVAQLLLKCCQLDAVPVLIARRIHFLTGRVFRTCGIVTHEMFTQLYPAADIDLANQAKHKNLLGYHDIRVGNAPDQRLLKFTLVNLPKILPAARRDFDHAKGPLLE